MSTVDRVQPKSSLATAVLPDGVGVAVLDIDAELLRRVSAEFHEMPDLAITVAQASRLFAVDHAHCRRILDALVNEGTLYTDGRLFARVGTGRHGI
jgi:hypothetical protein